jgi:hypothetical protein
VSALKRELFPLLGFPTNAMVYGRCMNEAQSYRLGVRLRPWND